MYSSNSNYTVGWMFRAGEGRPQSHYKAASLSDAGKEDAAVYLAAYRRLFENPLAVIHSLSHDRSACILRNLLDGSTLLCSASRPAFSFRCASNYYWQIPRTPNPGAVLQSLPALDPGVQTLQSDSAALSDLHRFHPFHHQNTSRSVLQAVQ